MHVQVLEQEMSRCKSYATGHQEQMEAITSKIEALCKELGAVKRAQEMQETQEMQEIQVTRSARNARNVRNARQARNANNTKPIPNIRVRSNFV